MVKFSKIKEMVTGCHVKYKGTYYPKCVGKTGRILGGVVGLKDTFAVKWDGGISGGHDCDGRCEIGYGWNVSKNNLVMING